MKVLMRISHQSDLNCINGYDSILKHLIIKGTVTTIRLLLIVLVVCCDSFLATAQTSPPTFTTSLFSPTGSLRIASAIQSNSFSNSQPMLRATTVESIPDQREMGSDTVVISPDTGVKNWLMRRKVTVICATIGRSQIFRELREFKQFRSNSVGSLSVSLTLTR